MRILKPGDPCPCCGEPIKEGLSREKMLLLNYLAEGKTVVEIAGMFEEDLNEQQ